MTLKDESELIEESGERELWTTGNNPNWECGSGYVQYVFGPPGSESVIILYGSGSESGSGSGSGSGTFQQQSNKVRKTLISTILWLLVDFFISENCCKNKQETFQKNFLPYLLGKISLSERESVLTRSMVSDLSTVMDCMWGVHRTSVIFVSKLNVNLTEKRVRATRLILLTKTTEKAYISQVKNKLTGAQYHFSPFVTYLDPQESVAF
jgi:hypothetical protein